MPHSQSLIPFTSTTPPSPAPLSSSLGTYISPVAPTNPQPHHSNLLSKLTSSRPILLLGSHPFLPFQSSHPFHSFPLIRSFHSMPIIPSLSSAIRYLSSLHNFPLPSYPMPLIPSLSSHTSNFFPLIPSLSFHSSHTITTFVKLQFTVNMRTVCFWLGLELLSLLVLGDWKVGASEQSPSLSYP